MAHPRRSILGMAVLLALAGPAAAVVPEIKDEGKFFSADAVKKANETIRDIYLKSNRDLLIETFTAVPADQAEKVKKLEGKEKGDYFHKWAEDRAKLAGVNGIYVLICKDPTYLWIEVTPSARKVFDGKKYNRLREIFFENLREKKFDEALQAAVKYVREQLGESR